jgi:hypothetical protein
LKVRNRRIVVDGLGVQGANEADIVDDFSGVRQQFADPDAVLAALLKREFWRDDRKAFLARRHAREALALTDGIGEFAAVKLLSLRLVIEKFQMRRPAGLEEIHDPFRRRGEMGLLARRGRIS